MSGRLVRDGRRGAAAGQRRLPQSVYAALIAGAERGITLDDNLAAFDELGFAPHVAGLPAEARPDDDGDGPACRCR